MRAGRQRAGASYRIPGDSQANEVSSHRMSLGLAWFAGKLIHGFGMPFNRLFGLSIQATC